MILLNQEPFPFQKTLLIALIGAIIGQFLILLIGWIKRKINLSRKKQMIVNDLKNQNQTLDLIIEKHNALNNLFIKRELHSIFKKDLAVLVDVYKSIEFIKNHGPYWIYNDYLEKLEIHLDEKKNVPNHNFYCETHLGFINIAIKNIQNNLITLQETKAKIKKLTD